MINPVHKCKIHCHTIDPIKLESMGIEDRGKWMPFTFLIDIVVACKLATDEEDLMPYGCTTVFTENGDTYIIDTPYIEFEELFTKFNTHNSSQDEEPNL